jgi:2-polyprenyl-6-hydroxyphenyl methylase / 3-demethylubiquinone-9 3-methyltransferase
VLDFQASQTVYDPMTDTPPSPAPSSFDPDEVARFDALARDWWNPQGPMKPLHEIGPARLAFVRDLVCRHFARDSRTVGALAGLSALDVGCGAGLVAEPLARMGAHVTGIDLGAEIVAAAQAHAAASRLDILYRQAKTDDLVAEGRRFDLVLCLEVIEHVPDPSAFVATAARLVSTGGLLVLSTINRTMKSFALAIVGAEYVLRWLPRGTHDWRKFVTPDELRMAVASAGFRTTDQQGIVFNPLAARWQLSPDCDVNYLLAATRAS